MLLIGQYDSPFVRRVAVALHLYGIAYEHAPWSTFRDADQIAGYNPLRRVPTLVADDGTVWTDSTAILEWVDQLAGERAFLDRAWPQRGEMLRLAAFATGTADKAVALVYERVLRPQPLDMWVARCRTQIGGTLGMLEIAREAAATRWLFGDSLSHADVAIAVLLRFIGEALGDAIDRSAYPALLAHSRACEALEVFQLVSQPFFISPPKS
jgi:glutathione S-transferase